MGLSCFLRYVTLLDSHMFERLFVLLYWHELLVSETNSHCSPRICGTARACAPRATRRSCSDESHPRTKHCSHSQPPADGALVLPDLLYSFPTDQIGKSAQAQWDAAKLPVSLDARVRVDVYDGPQGKGFVVIVQSQLNGATWQRSINYGPETYRDQGWTELKPLP